MEIKNLPRLKHELKTTRSMLEKLLESKGEISKERYENLRKTYTNRITELEKKVQDLSDDAETQKFELEQKINIANDNLDTFSEESKELDLLKEKQAISDEEYKTKNRDNTRRIRQAESEKRTHIKRLDEVVFYLEQIGDVDYTKHKMQEFAGEAGKGIKSVYGKASNITHFIGRIIRMPVYAVQIIISVLTHLAMRRWGIVLVIIVGIILLLNLVFGHYASKQMGPILAEQIEILKEREDVIIEYNKFRLNPLLRKIDFSDVSLYTDDKIYDFKFDKAYVQLTWKQTWRLIKAFRDNVTPNEIIGISIGIRNLRGNIEELQFFYIENVGIAFRGLLELNENIENFVNHDQLIKTTIQTSHIEYYELIELLSLSDQRKIFGNTNTKLHMRYSAANRVFNIRNYTHQNDYVNVEIAGQISVSIGEHGEISPYALLIEGLMSMRDITHNVEDGRIHIEEYKVATIKPLRINFDREQWDVHIKSEFEARPSLYDTRDLREDLREYGLTLSDINQKFRMSFEYEGSNFVHDIHSATLSGWMGDIIIHGRILLDNNYEQASFDNLRVRAQGVPAGIIQILESEFGHSLPRREGAYSFRMDGNVEYPSITGW